MTKALATYSLGSIMAGLRVSAQLRQTDLAAETGLSGAERVSNIENDKSPLTVDLFMAWCGVCRADPSEVMATIVNKSVG